MAPEEPSAKRARTAAAAAPWGADWERVPVRSGRPLMEAEEGGACGRPEVRSWDRSEFWRG